ncbi:MAG: hypothetical protein V3T05_10695 [Myxococcota bacterium]
MVKRCRVCKKLTVEGSMFCSDHYRQAATFSLAFGQQDQLPATGDAADNASSRPRGTVSGDDRNSFNELVLGVFEHVVEKSESKENEVNPRWPQISVYYLNDCWHARPYYAVVPRRDGGDHGSVAPFAMADARRDFEPGRMVFDALVEQFETHLDDLKNHQVQALDIHFITYAGVIAINAHHPNRADRNLATFKLEGGEFVPTELDEVSERFRRPAW